MGQELRRSGDDRTRGQTPKGSGEEVTVAANDERQGRISLWISMVGLVLPVLLAMVFAVLLERNILREPDSKLVRTRASRIES
jgi:hypothetical protein